MSNLCDFVGNPLIGFHTVEVCEEHLLLRLG